MGYEVHITRRQNWLDDEGPTITLREWLHVVHGDPELEHDGVEEALAAGDSTLSPGEPGLAVWTGYSLHGPDKVAFFCHYEDHLTATNPDEEVVRKMWRLARKLKAKVQGDDGEIYGADGKPMSDEEARAAGLLVARRNKKKPWWKFW